MTKGDVHIAAVRGFVDYAINSNVARRFLEWEKLNQHPDESFFNTLNFDPRLGAPGSSVGQSGIPRENKQANKQTNERTNERTSKPEQANS